MCKKQTSVSHSSTESKVTSLGLRTDGIPALDLWDLVMEVVHSSRNTQASRNRLREEVNNQVSSNRLRNDTQSTNTNTKTKRHNNWYVDESPNADHVAKPPHFQAQLCIFEDNEAVIKMNQGQKSNNETRVPNHRVALDWLFD